MKSVIELLNRPLTATGKIAHEALMRTATTSFYTLDEEKFGVDVVERFDVEVNAFFSGDIWSGDCDTLNWTPLWAMMTQGYDAHKLTRIACQVDSGEGGGHAIGGIIDDEIKDVWILDNRLMYYSDDALNSWENFQKMSNAPTYKQVRENFATPVLCLLSDLKEGIVFPTRQGNEVQLQEQIERYKLESFHLLCDPVTKWWKYMRRLPKSMDMRD